jgi:acyl phosphate:glycerol-3-phosphate acyltransferase
VINALNLLIIVVVSYFIGALPTAYLIARFIHKVNIFDLGSGNMGGTNVARIAGLHWGIFTVVIDATKGMMAVYVAQQLMPASMLPASMFAAIWAVIGHNWSLIASLLYRHYRGEFKIIGGKGAATALGTMIMLFPPEAIILLLITGVGLAIVTRYASLSVLISFTLALTWAAVWAIQNSDTRANALTYLVYIFSIAILILWRFRENITRLMQGTERRLGERV